MGPGLVVRPRRRVRDYETTETSAEAPGYVARIGIQLRRVAWLLTLQAYSDRHLAIRNNIITPQNANFPPRGRAVKMQNASVILRQEQPRGLFPC